MRYTSSTIGCCPVDDKQRIGHYGGNAGTKDTTLMRCSYSRRFTVSKKATTTTDIFSLDTKVLRQDERRLTTTTTTQRTTTKKVRFADDEGGLLCSVKIFEEKPFVYQPRLHTTPAFSKTNLTNYTTVYNETKLSLKQVCVVAYGLVGGATLFGAIAVRNLAFKKHVTVRITLDGWKTSSDIKAKFVQSEFNGHIDRFFFMKPLTELSFEEISQDIEFAVCYTVNDTEYWDNNGGSNYKFVSKDKKLSPDFPHL